MSQSIVEYFAEHEGYKCGYCKSPNTNFSHGMWAHTMSPNDYEGLLNRGWRRSGMYCYKPINSVTCCPMYTISCSALKFNISKSQRKVLKKFNAYLQGGILEAKALRTGTGKCVTTKTTSEVEIGTTEILDGQERSRDLIKIRKGIYDILVPDPQDEAEARTDQSTPMIADGGKSSKPKQNSSKLKFPSPNTNTTKSMRPNLNRNTETEVRTGSTFTPATSVRVRKSKEIRLERKRLKMMERGIDISTSVDSKMNAAMKGKQLEDFIDVQNVKRKFHVKLLNTNSEEFKTTFDKEFDVYKKYQIAIHGDREDECTNKQFKRFLCDSPINNEDNESHCGTFHQLYYIDETLIAVGVIDILPTALSSVYFFYDPSYMALSPGTLGALKEISFLRELNKTHRELKYYYMGFYIHSCTKMRYKGCFFPSYLLCPKSFTWVCLDDKLRKRLEENKYCAFGRQCEEYSSQAQKSVIVDIRKVSILYRRTILPYEIYELKKGKEDQQEIQQYCNLVGDDIAERLLLYRS